MADTGFPDSADDDFEQELRTTGLRPDTESDPEGRWGWTPGRVLSTILLVLVAGFWVWAFSPFAPNTHPDELDDPGFADAARPLCAEAAEAIKQLPRAYEVDTAAERADLIDRGTAIYRELILSLRSIAPDLATSDGDVVGRWLDDYEIYLDDRDAYASKFRAGIDEPFEVTVKGEGQITDPIDAFTVGNRMADCASPNDV